MVASTLQEHVNETLDSDFSLIPNDAMLREQSLLATLQNYLKKRQQKLNNQR